MKKALALGFLTFSALGSISSIGSSICRLCNQKHEPLPVQKPSNACQQGKSQPQKVVRVGLKTCKSVEKSGKKSAEKNAKKSAEKSGKKSVEKDSKQEKYQVCGIHGQGCNCGHPQRTSPKKGLSSGKVCAIHGEGCNCGSNCCERDRSCSKESDSGKSWGLRREHSPSPKHGQVCGTHGKRCSCGSNHGGNCGGEKQHKHQQGQQGQQSSCQGPQVPPSQKPPVCQGPQVPPSQQPPVCQGPQVPPSQKPPVCQGPQVPPSQQPPVCQGPQVPPSQGPVCQGQPQIPQGTVCQQTPTGQVCYQIPQIPQVIPCQQPSGSQCQNIKQN